MSLLNTKPRWFQDAVATDSGWANPKTGEVLVAIGNLRAKLEAETPVEATEIKSDEVIIKEEIVMEAKIETPVKVKREYNKKPKVIGEVVEEKLETTHQIIGEVVEHYLDK